MWYGNLPRPAGQLTSYVDGRVDHSFPCKFTEKYLFLRAAADNYHRELSITYVIKELHDAIWLFFFDNNRLEELSCAIKLVPETK